MGVDFESDDHWLENHEKHVVVFICFNHMGKVRHSQNWGPEKDC